MDIPEFYRKNNAILKGHFELNSGKHSEFYIQNSKISQYPELLNLLAKELLKEIQKFKIEFDTICSIAISGILLGYELAKITNKKFIFSEKNDEDFIIKRGFKISQNEKILVCDEVITNASSILKTANLIKEYGADIVGFVSLINRGIYKNDNLKCKSEKRFKNFENIPFLSLHNFEFEIYEKDSCPLCKKGIKFQKIESVNQCQNKKQ